MAKVHGKWIKNALIVLADQKGFQAIPYPDAFPALDYYPAPKALLRTQEARWLYFLDCLLSRIDVQGSSLIVFNLDRCLARRAISERTLRNYLARITEEGWLIPRVNWLLQLADTELRGTAWDALAPAEKKQFVRELFGDEPRTRTFHVSERFLQSERLFKPRDYVRRGWSDYRLDLAARQVINGLFWGMTRKMDPTRTPFSAFQTSEWELQTWTRDVHGSLPDGFRAAVTGWVEDGVLRKDRASRIFFELNAMSRPSPWDPSGDARQRLRRDMERKLGLDADVDKERISLLIHLVNKKILREREVNAFLNRLDKNHPHLLQEKEFKMLVDWMIMQYDSGRPWPGWKKALGDFVTLHAKRPEPLGAWIFRFAARTADGDSFVWLRPRAFWTAFVIRYRLLPKKNPGTDSPRVRVGVLRDLDLRVLGDETNPSRRFYRVADVSYFLKKLAAGEAVSVFAVASGKDDVTKVKIELLGYRAKPLQRS